MAINEPKILTREGFVPIPDPTKLTTEAVALMKSQLVELFGQQFSSVEKDIERLRKEIDHSPHEVRQELCHLRILMDEKFKGVDQQFLGNATALAAALLAQKTSVEEQNKANAMSAAKSEAGFAKQIDSITALITSEAKSTDGKINDAKDRLTAIESHGKGISDGWGWIVGGVGFILSVVGIVSAGIAIFGR